MVVRKTKSKTHRIVSPAIKPGTYGEYLWNHPEEVERILREHGVNIEKLNKILDEGGGVIQLNIGQKNKSKEKDT